MVTLAGTAGSLLAGTSLRELRFRQRFNATVLAVKRTGATLRDRLGRLVLREGDLLLIQAPLDALRGLQQSSDLVVLGQLNADLPTTHSKHLAVAVMATVLLAVGVLVLGDCLDDGSALRAIRWDIYLLLGGLYSLSVALQQSGLAALAARSTLNALQGWPAYGALVAVYTLTLLATELLSNAAAVALLLPIAANLAPGLQLPPMLLITAVVFAASQSFLSPIGYQTNLMVFGPGRYRFLDIPRYGFPLTLTMTVVVPLLICRWFGL